MDLQGDGVGCSSSPLPAPWVCSTAAAAGAGMGQQGMAQGAGCRCPVHPIARRRGWHGQAQRQRAAAARQRMRAWRCRRARSTARGACCRRCCHAPPQSAFVSVLTCVRVGKHAGLRRSCGERCTCKRHTGRRRGLVATWRCRARRMRMVARARGRADARTHTHARGACERSFGTWSRSSAQACVRARRTPSHACSARWPRTCVGVWVQAAAPTPLPGAVPGSTGGAVTPTWPRRRHDGTNVKWAAKVHTWSASVHKTTSA